MAGVVTGVSRLLTGVGMFANIDFVIPGIRSAVATATSAAALLETVRDLHARADNFPGGTLYPELQAILEKYTRIISAAPPQLALTATSDDEQQQELYAPPFRPRGLREDEASSARSAETGSDALAPLIELKF